MVQVLSRSPQRASGIASTNGRIGISWNAWLSEGRWVISVHAGGVSSAPELIDDIRQALLRPAEEWSQRWRQTFFRGRRGA